MSETGAHVDSRMTVRLASQADDFFYLGYRNYPGKETTKTTLDNTQGYKPETLHANEDGSVTVEWMQHNFGFTKKQRKHNFYLYAVDLVIPRLEIALQSEVDFDSEVHPVNLQRVSIQPRANIEEGSVAVKQKLGSMSLFKEAAALMAADTVQVSR